MPSGAIVDRDADLAARVIAEDDRVNDAQHEITDNVVMTIATHSPVARALRFLMALDHVAFELEQIGDHASGIAKQARWLFEDRADPRDDWPRSATSPRTSSGRRIGADRHR